VPVALDGFIAGAAALVAVTLAPDARHALFASHRSAEPGHAHALAHLGLAPYLDLGLRLGEGTGAALFVHLARAAALVWSEMATFKSAGISKSEGASTAPSEASPRNSIAPAKPALEPGQ
jgi:nicotinate-nucleotide--dimethylbenzimidazole phosphoribosyltransferase